MNKNDMNVVIFKTVFGLKYLLRTANSIRPPSKLDIGKRFSAPKKSEDDAKYSKNKFSNGKRMKKERKFTNGPAAQSKISFLNEKIGDEGVRPAPKAPIDNSLSVIFKSLAAQM